MEGGELFDRVVGHKRLKEATCKLYFTQMLPGRAGQRSPPGAFDNFLLGELLSELVENEGPGIKPREQSLCLGCSVLGRNTPPL